MWTVLESGDAAKAVAKLQPQVARKYAIWKNIVRQEGPEGLKKIASFNDEALKGQLRGRRSSRLNQQFRVIYTVDRDEVSVDVLEVTAHEYRR